MKSPWLTQLLSCLRHARRMMCKVNMWKKDLLGGETSINSMVGSQHTAHPWGPQVSGKVPKGKEWRSAWSRRAVTVWKGRWLLRSLGLILLPVEWPWRVGSTYVAATPCNYTISNPSLPHPPTLKCLSHLFLCSFLSPYLITLASLVFQFLQAVIKLSIEVLKKNRRTTKQTKKHPLRTSSGESRAVRGPLLWAWQLPLIESRAPYTAHSAQVHICFFFY